MGQCAGHPDKPHLAGLSELQECIERAVLFQSLPGWRGMELHNVEIVGLHPHKTLFDPRHDVVAGEDVLPPLAARRRGCTDQTAAFAGQVIFSAPVRDVAADPLLAQPVIDRGVDVIDAGVEHLVENGFCLGLGDIAGTRGSTQSHRSIAQGRDLQPRPPELSFCYGHSRPPLAELPQC